MHVSRRAIRLAVSAGLAITALVAFTPGSPALADQPYFQTFNENYTAVHHAECAFDVTEHGEGTVRWMYHPNNGNPTAAIYHYDLRGTYTNMVTGRSLTWSQDAVLRGYYQDGSLILFVIGLDLRINAPGQGRVVADVGRLVARLTPGNPEPEIIFEAGQWDRFSALCAALE